MDIKLNNLLPESLWDGGRVLHHVSFKHLGVSCQTSLILTQISCIFADLVTTAISYRLLHILKTWKRLRKDLLWDLKRKGGQARSKGQI